MRRVHRREKKVRTCLRRCSALVEDEIRKWSGLLTRLKTSVCGRQSFKITASARNLQEGRKERAHRRRVLRARNRIEMRGTQTRSAARKEQPGCATRDSARESNFYIKAAAIINECDASQSSSYLFISPVAPTTLTLHADVAKPSRLILAADSSADFIFSVLTTLLTRGDISRVDEQASISQ